MTTHALTALTPRPGPPGPVPPACIASASLFQDPLLEDGPGRGAPAAVRRRHADLLAAASRACGGCPLRRECLYRAVVEHDVSGFAGGTTAGQREQIRRRLGVAVPPEDLDTLAGVTGAGRPVDHAAVLRVRAAHPDESLEVLAGRLGCSLSTVKRHLRRERNAPAAPATPAVRPTVPEVLRTAAAVLHPASSAPAAAAA